MEDVREYLQFGAYRKDRDDEVPMKPVINELYADNGALCGYSLIDPLSGETLWTDDEEPLVDTGSKETQEELFLHKKKRIMDCAQWLVFCLEIGYPKSSLDALEKLWNEHHPRK